jgi:branched-chain amino acid transport system permease protein
VIGGIGTLPGAIWGSLLVVLLQTYATDVATSHGLSATVGANIPVAAYGVILILVMLIFPQGLHGALRRLFTGFAAPRRPTPEKEGTHEIEPTELPRPKNPAI